MQDLVYKLLLAPFSLLYGIGVGLRNSLYHLGLLKGASFDIPTISVGNLTVGGAGKTPHVEYLILFLREYIKVGTLSRGYKRKTKGFLTVQPNHTANDVGDEPLQFKRKFRDVFVAVAEDRTFAIPNMLMEDPHLQVVLLDDAFQHLAVNPGLNILLTEYDYPFTRDYLLPSGRLREWPSAYTRADIIIVSKCPDQVSEEEKVALIKEIGLKPKQRIYFSYYTYQDPYYLMNGQQRITLDDSWDVLLVCAIARSEYLIQYLKANANTVIVKEFSDHHLFTKQEVGNVKGIFEDMEGRKKIILTTEKDAVRLDLHREFLIQHQLPVFVLPAQVAFHFDDEERFRQDIIQFMMNFKV